MHQRADFHGLYVFRRLRFVRRLEFEHVPCKILKGTRDVVLQAGGRQPMTVQPLPIVSQMPRDAVAGVQSSVMTLLRPKRLQALLQNPPPRLGFFR